MGGWNSPRTLGLDSTCFNSNGGTICKTQPQHTSATGVCTADRVSINISVVSAYNSSEGATHQLKIISNDISKNIYRANVLKHSATNNLIDLDYSFKSGLYTVIIQSAKLGSASYSARHLEPIKFGIKKFVALQSGYTTYITFTISRKQSVIYDIDIRFDVKQNNVSLGKAPWYEWDSMSQVAENKTIIERQAKMQGVDPDLVKAIIYMETTHGYYDTLVAPFDKNTSILPMNIRSGYWKQLGYSRKELKNPALNIEAGIYLLKKLRKEQNLTTLRLSLLYTKIWEQHELLNMVKE